MKKIAELENGFTLITVQQQEFWCELNGYKPSQNQFRDVTKYVQFRIHLYLNPLNFIQKSHLGIQRHLNSFCTNGSKCLWILILYKRKIVSVSHRCRVFLTQKNIDITSPCNLLNRSFKARVFFLLNVF